MSEDSRLILEANNRLKQTIAAKPKKDGSHMYEHKLC